MELHAVACGCRTWRAPRSPTSAGQRPTSGPAQAQSSPLTEGDGPAVEFPRLAAWWRACCEEEEGAEGERSVVVERATAKAS